MLGFFVSVHPFAIVCCRCQIASFVDESFYGLVHLSSEFGTASDGLGESCPDDWLKLAPFTMTDAFSVQTITIFLSDNIATLSNLLHHTASGVSSSHLQLGILTSLQEADPAAQLNTSLLGSTFMSHGSLRGSAEQSSHNLVHGGFADALVGLFCFIIFSPTLPL
ncbi:unnamed protein product, partial [Protopolystoma xenopodis]